MIQISSLATTNNSGLDFSPLVIGGNGGSGTRLVAEILIQAGIFMGSDLNRSNDNLLFTYLFKHPKQYAQYLNEDIPLCEALFALHEKMFLHNVPLTLKELRLIAHAGREHVNNPYYGRRWILQRWQKMLESRGLFSPFKKWGWKEPYSMFFLKGLISYYPNVKFILVLRDGLDMAFSKNDQQFKYWSSAYGINPSDSSVKRKFEFWYRSNRDAIRFGATYMNANFLVLKFEDLCISPESTIVELLKFAGLDINSIPHSVWSLPELPTSHGRYHKFDTAWITAEVTRKLSELDYAH